MKNIDIDYILMVLSGATMIIFTLVVLGTALIGNATFGG